MSEETVFDAWINPLVFLEVDEPWASLIQREPDHKAVLRYLCSPETEDDLSNLVRRYKEISRESGHLFAAPAEQRMIAKLVWPLKNAKGCYMVGNYLGTIALCGVVAEMTAVLLFVISPIPADSVPGKSKDSIERFERLGQKQRVKILREHNLINEHQKGLFEIIRETRRGYLHYYSKNPSQSAADARRVFQAADAVVRTMIGQGIRDGKIILNPALVRYLKRKGIARPPDEADEEGGKVG